MGPRLGLHRWFRFRLRTLLLFVVIVAIPVAWIAKERRQSFREHQIADELRKQGFPTITFGGPYERWSEPYPPHLPQVWWRNFAKQVLGERIVKIDVIPPQINPKREPAPPLAVSGFDDLTLIAEVTNLQCLNLDTTQVKDLTPLADMRTLQWLCVSSDQCTDLTPLVGLRNLQKIWLNNTGVSDLAPLIGLPNLTQVSVNKSKVEPDQINALQKALPSCVIYP